MKNHSPQNKDFQQRLKRIDKTVRKAQRAKPMKRTGVMDHKEQMRRKAKRKTISWGGVFKTGILLWILFIGLKTFMANQMGRADYEARVAELRAGSTAERFFSYALERGVVMNAIERFTSKAEDFSNTNPQRPVEDGSESSVAPSEETATEESSN